MRKRSTQDKTTMTVKERVNLPSGGYRITTTTKVHHEKSAIDILIDLFS